MNFTIPDPEWLTVYSDADYCVCCEPPFILKIGQPSPELTALYAQYQTTTAAFITACDPHGKALLDDINAERQHSFQALLNTQGWHSIAGIGQDPTGERRGEASFLVLGISQEEAYTLGKTLSQNAIVFCGDDAIPALMWTK